MPALEGLPNLFIAEVGTQEHENLLARVESGDLSRGKIKDDELLNRVPQREVFCPRDFDIFYVSAAVLKYLGTMGVEWSGEHFSPKACRFAPLEVYVDEYNRQHRISVDEGEQ